ncbi:hypothetical protein CAOG_08233 [Capsaspora owczarzaki ATCC 30864]|uniref:Glycolipid transfer protein domain-containing protein n=1 Tax=Capsaspora owczarzaki (strain ATCC 30864) TaxID=595528 RepID=A0A0D2WY07_CAPO3|nr:hypothetical protein CAOG_08233 [Capsaspora owczarzaki ATCC 30864]KJE98240.1 hypothetical protein CAOG_008233 [Capsaspora owczarzaki ATCC 30864]|eukprot:XP_004342488.1 hypothetical protein CAOG_08233 [Capsaspora owczarzaki ATCC 30864]
MAAEPFSFPKVVDMFERVDTHAGKAANEIETIPFLDAYFELSKVFDHLGRAFKFVTADVVEKIDILRKHHELRENAHSTLDGMLRHELENNLTDTTSSGGLRSGSRTLLRLNRALEFILAFFDRMIEAKEDAACSTLAGEAYANTLSKHHGWAVRSAVNLALYTLPSLSELIRRLDVSRDDGIAYLKRIVASVRPMYDHINGLYTTHDLHSLP